MSKSQKIRLKLLRLKRFIEEYEEGKFSQKDVADFSAVVNSVKNEVMQELFKTARIRTQKIGRIMRLSEDVANFLKCLPLPKFMYEGGEGLEIMRLDEKGGFVLNLIREGKDDCPVNLLYVVHPGAYGYNDCDSETKLTAKILQSEFSEEKLVELEKKLASILKDVKMLESCEIANHISSYYRIHVRHSKRDHEGVVLRGIKLRGGVDVIQGLNLSGETNLERRIGAAVYLVPVKKAEYLIVVGDVTNADNLAAELVKRGMIIESALTMSPGKKQTRWPKTESFLALGFNDLGGLPLGGEDFVTIERKFDVAIKLLDTNSRGYSMSVSGPEKNVKNFSKKYLFEKSCRQVYSFNYSDNRERGN
ncbi:MAG: hypothetical protein HYT63_04000 [Candidatus Yanofskybacteria bacterium]|nr:hypothetical protein [Candidatus Yanofskybacteria bacterium]